MQHRSPQNWPRSAALAPRIGHVVQATVAPRICHVVISHGNILELTINLRGEPVMKNDVRRSDKKNAIHGTRASEKAKSFRNGIFARNLLSYHDPLSNLLETLDEKIGPSPTPGHARNAIMTVLLAISPDGRRYDTAGHRYTQGTSDHYYKALLTLCEGGKNRHLIQNKVVRSLFTRLHVEDMAKKGNVGRFYRRGK